MSLQTLIQQIKYASAPGENTALRIGSTFEQIDLLKRDTSDSLSKKETIDLLNSVKIQAVTGSKFIGKITPSSVIPSGIDVWGFAEAGTYPNANGIIVPVNKSAILSRVAGIWSKVETNPDIVQNVTNNVVNITQTVDPSQIVPSEALYNDPAESIAVDIEKRIDFQDGYDVNYNISANWYDGTPITDARLDNDIFVKIDGVFKRKMIDKKVLLKINTIADLRNQNGYYEGQEIILSGYYERGDKSPVTYKFTIDDFDLNTDNGGSIIKSSRGSWILQTETISVKDFGAKGDNITDDSESFRKTIKYAYSRSLVNTGWRHPIKIYIPNGRYAINSTIINQTSNVSAGRFVFEGETQYGAVINIDFSGFLFDNVQHFGFTTFLNLTFRGKYIGKFMNMVGGGSANVQSFIFEKCAFERLNRIAVVTSSSMGSEVVFRDCKISDADGDSILFSFANEQAVNWRFYSTDIESFSGVLFEYLQGMSINFYQGSIIPQFEGIIARIPVTAGLPNFGDNNNPLLTCWGVRFEMRQNAKLLVANSSVFFAMNFYSCGMGTFNQNVNNYLITIRDNAQLTFTDCENLNKLKIQHVIGNDSSYLYTSKVIYNGKAPTFKQIEAGTCNAVNNSSGSPIYVVNTPDYNITYRPFYKENKNGIVNNLRIYPKENSNRFFNGISTVSMSDYCEISTPDILPFYNAKFVIAPAWSGGYGGQTFDYEIIINGTLFGTGTLNTSKGKIIELINVNGDLVDYSNRLIKLRLLGTSTYTSTLGMDICLELN